MATERYPWGRTFTLLFLCYYLVQSLFYNRTVYEFLLTRRLRGSALSFLATNSVALMLRGERPRLRCRSEEHLRDFYPVTAISTSEEGFFRARIRNLSPGGVRRTHRADRVHEREVHGR